MITGRVAVLFLRTRGCRPSLALVDRNKRRRGELQASRNEQSRVDYVWS
jgi:hypothetical protein